MSKHQHCRNRQYRIDIVEHMKPNKSEVFETRTFFVTIVKVKVKTKDKYSIKMSICVSCYRMTNMVRFFSWAASVRFANVSFKNLTFSWNLPVNRGKCQNQNQCSARIEFSSWKVGFSTLRIKFKRYSRTLRGFREVLLDFRWQWPKFSVCIWKFWLDTEWHSCQIRQNS